MSRWTLFSNHGHVLLYLAGDPESRLRDVSAAVGITERAVQKIVRDLQDAGILTVSKRGRRNRYRVNHRKPLRHQLESHRTVGDLVELINEDSAKPRREAAAPAPVAKAKPTDSERPPVSAPGPEPMPGEPPGQLTPEQVPPEEEPPVTPEPAPPPAPVPATEPASPAAKPDKPRKKRQRTPPADEQQGSLF
jgi:DNA-binding transcriptional ArsR family regulator